MMVILMADYLAAWKVAKMVERLDSLDSKWVVQMELYLAGQMVERMEKTMVEDLVVVMVELMVVPLGEKRVGSTVGQREVRMAGSMADWRAVY